MTTTGTVSNPAGFERALQTTNYRQQLMQTRDGVIQGGFAARKLASEKHFDQIIEKTVEKALTYNANTQYLHGPGGFLNQPGVDQAIFSTIYRPMGVSRILPYAPSTAVSPIFETITAQTGDVGSEPSDEVSDPVKSGQMTVGALTAPFGSVMRRTDTIVVSRPGQIVNRADPLDLRVVNDMTSLSPLIPDPAKNNPDFINSELGTHLWKLGLSFERKFEPMLFTGNTSNNVGTGYMEFYGYNQFINTGHIDVMTGTLLPALDSLIVNWNSGNITGNVQLNGGNWNITQTVSAICAFLYNKALRTGMLPCEWALAMRYDVFWELTYLWPASYLTNGASVMTNNAQLFVAATDQVSMRDDMRTGQFLWINGMRYPVVITDGISESTANGFTRSDIYFIPISANGQMVNYMQYYDFNNQQLSQITDLPVGNRYWVSNGGLYLWTYTNQGYGIWLQAEAKPRMVLRTPWLAARLQNIGYATAIHSSDAFLTSLYAAPGGGTSVGNYNPTALYPTAV